MSAKCCHAPRRDQHQNDPRYKRVLWLVLAINASMFLFELILGFAARSVALQADAVDFFGDAANYGISLLVAGLALQHRARAALVKAISMGLFGLWIVGSLFGTSRLERFLKPRRWARLGWRHCSQTL
jgi:Co/Zn/Cd efflux system component